jgi:hypothetical protein
MVASSARAGDVAQCLTKLVVGEGLDHPGIGAGALARNPSTERSSRITSRGIVSGSTVALISRTTAMPPMFLTWRSMMTTSGSVSSTVDAAAKGSSRTSICHWPRESDACTSLTTQVASATRRAEGIGGQTSGGFCSPFLACFHS